MVRRGREDGAGPDERAERKRFDAAAAEALGTYGLFAGAGVVALIAIVALVSHLARRRLEERL